MKKIQKLTALIMVFAMMFTVSGAVQLSAENGTSQEVVGAFYEEIAPAISIVQGVNVTQRLLYNIGGNLVYHQGILRLGEQFRAEVTITNNSPTEINPMLIVTALYDGRVTYIRHSSSTNPILNGGSGNLNVNYDIPLTGIDEIRVFVLDRIALIPYTNAAILTSYLSFDVRAGDYVSIPVSAKNISNAIEYHIRFNSENFELVNAREQSATPILATGVVAGANLNITSITNRSVSFRRTTNASAGVVNTVQLRARRTGDLSVTVYATAATPADGNIFNYDAYNDGAALTPFFYLEPCESFSFESPLDREFEDNAVIIVLDRAKSRITSIENKDFTIADFNDIGAIYVEDLIRLTDWEHTYAQRFWEAEQQRILEENFPSDNPGHAEAVKMEYMKARIEGEANTLVNFDHFRRILLIRLDQNCQENVLSVVSQLEQRAYIVSAEPNFIKVPDIYVSNPNDFYFQLPSTNVNYQWAVRRIGLPQAWGFIGDTSTSTVSVGIIGWGIDANHPELAGRVSVGPFGSTSLVSWGTHQAGIIGASGNNDGIGIAGISWNVQLVSLSFVDSIMAINAGRDGLIPILTASFSWGYSNFEISAVQSYTGLFVNSAGNNGQNGDLNPRFAGLPNVLVVGASNMNDGRSVWGGPTSSSNYGANSVHLFAPGGGVVDGVTRNIRTTGTAVNVFNQNEYIEILVFRDGMHEVLFSRQIVAPVLF